MNILLISTNESVKKDLNNFLQLYFSNVFYLRNIHLCFKVLKKQHIDIIIVDINKSYLQELLFLQIFRQYNNKTKIIVLSQLIDEYFLIELIPLNLTQYILKPIDFNSFRKIILQTIEQIKKEEKTHKIIRLVDNYYWDLTRQKLFHKDQNISLTKNELNIFKHYCNQQNKIFSYYDILTSLEEGYDSSDNRAKMIIKRIRKKLSSNIIENIYGVGYRFNILH
jgi:DNA-binding response OmpR family regulator